MRCYIHIQDLLVKESEDITDEFSSFAQHYLVNILETLMREYTKLRNSMMRYRKLVQKIVQ